MKLSTSRMPKDCFVLREGSHLYVAGTTPHRPLPHTAVRRATCAPFAKACARQVAQCTSEVGNVVLAFNIFQRPQSKTREHLPENLSSRRICARKLSHQMRKVEWRIHIEGSFRAASTPARAQPSPSCTMSQELATLKRQIFSIKSCSARLAAIVAAAVE